MAGPKLKLRAGRVGLRRLTERRSRKMLILRLSLCARAEVFPFLGKQESSDPNLLAAPHLLYNRHPEA